MQLVVPSQVHLDELMAWFKNERQLREWAGPGFRYPFDQSTFKNDLKLDSLESISLLSGNHELLAFGQCYLRLDKCHLGRLAVSPRYRGQGLASELINLLSELGTKKFKVDACSLFVLEDNASAIKAYRKAGFAIADYPETMPIEACLYMTRNV